MSKFRKKRKLMLALVGAISFSGSLAGCQYNDAYAEYLENPAVFVFEEQKVMNDIEYYGGDERYVENEDSFQDLFVKNDVELMNHFNTGKEGPIKVGYATNVSDEQAVQFDYTFKHLNDVFAVINPNYKFETGRFYESESDIFVEFEPMGRNTGSDGMYTTVGAYVDWKFDKDIDEVVRGATIRFNSSLDLAEPQLRYYMLHEMMHVLYGSKDVDWNKSPTFSVYNYCDVDFIIRQISNAYESKEDYENNVIKSLGGNWSTLFDIHDKDGNAIGRVFLPVMTREEKLSFVSLLPTDASTLVALYGDSSKEENRQAYLKLLHNILDTNKEVFDIDYTEHTGYQDRNVTEQPYYEDGYTLPAYEGMPEEKESEYPAPPSLEEQLRDKYGWPAKDDNGKE